MKLHRLGNNTAEVTRPDGRVIFFSYDTAVAAYVPGEGWFRTSKKWSRTTTKHINGWLGDAPFRELPQEQMDKLLGGPSDPIVKTIVDKLYG